MGLTTPLTPDPKILTPSLWPLLAYTHAHTHINMKQIVKRKIALERQRYEDHEFKPTLLQQAAGCASAHVHTVQ